MSNLISNVIGQRFRCRFSGSYFTCSRLVASGGEGALYRVAENERLVAKLYHRRTIPYDLGAAQDHLALMVHKLTVLRGHGKLLPEEEQRLLAWPVDLLEDRVHQLVGYLMPYVTSPFANPTAYELCSLYNGMLRSQLEFPIEDARLLATAASQVAQAVRVVHGIDGLIIGDLNAKNFLVRTNGHLTIVDVDSFQIRDRQGHFYPCRVGMAEYLPPEVQGLAPGKLYRKQEQDRFGLATLLFQILMNGVHPFDFRYGGAGDPPDRPASIKMGLFPYARKRRMPAGVAPSRNAPPFTRLPVPVQSLFLRCFDEGHSRPELRPTAQEWATTLRQHQAATEAYLKSVLPRR